MDITRLTARTHIETAHENLQHANNVPIEHCLPFLEAAMDNLGAAIDTIKQARKEAAEVSTNRRRLPSLTPLGNAESKQATAERHLADTHLTQLIHQAGNHA